MKEHHKKIISIEVNKYLDLRYATLECGHTQLTKANRVPGNVIKCGQCRRAYRSMLQHIYPAIFR